MSVLCCAVLCCAVLCCAVLCCAVLCCAVLCCAVLCCAVRCCALLLWALIRLAVLSGLVSHIELYWAAKFPPVEDSLSADCRKICYDHCQSQPVMLRFLATILLLCHCCPMISSVLALLLARGDYVLAGEQASQDQLTFLQGCHEWYLTASTCIKGMCVR